MIKRFHTFLAASVLASTLCMVEPVVVFADNPVITQVLQLQTSAMDDYDMFEFDAANEKLNKAIQLIEENGLITDPKAAQIYIAKGIVEHARLKDKDSGLAERRAFAQFVEAASADIRVEIPKDYKSSELEAILNRAKLKVDPSISVKTVITEAPKTITLGGLSDDNSSTGTATFFEASTKTGATTVKEPGKPTQPTTTQPVVTTPEPTKTEPVVATTEPTKTEPVVATTEPAKTEPVVTTPEPAKTEPVVVTTEPAKTEPVVATTEPAKTEPVVATTEPAKTEPVVATTEPAKTEPVVATTEPAKTEPVVATTEPAKTEPVVATTEPAKTEPAVDSTASNNDAPVKDKYFFEGTLLIGTGVGHANGATQNCAMDGKCFAPDTETDPNKPLPKIEGAVPMLLHLRADFMFHLPKDFQLGAYIRYTLVDPSQGSVMIGAMARYYIVASNPYRFFVGLGFGWGEASTTYNVGRTYMENGVSKSDTMRDIYTIGGKKSVHLMPQLGFSWMPSEHFGLAIDASFPIHLNNNAYEIKSYKFNPDGTQKIYNSGKSAAGFHADLSIGPVFRF